MKDLREKMLEIRLIGIPKENYSTTKTDKRSKRNRATTAKQQRGDCGF